MSSHGWSHLPATYDVVSGEYAAMFSDELDRKPFDRNLLDRLADDVAGDGLVCDLGCGPGHIGAYLADRGCDVIGIDLSPGMLACARQRHPDLRFQVGDMRALPLADASCVAVASFYSLIHIPRPEVPAVLREIHRVLRRNGRLILAVHGGKGEAHTDAWFGHAVAVDMTLFSSGELIALLNDAGFTECHSDERDPYPSEHQTRRLYVQATS